LPKEYVKTKGIEKKIFGVSCSTYCTACKRRLDKYSGMYILLLCKLQEHKNITNLAIDKHSMSEVEAKVKYTQVARSLKTYGITFFLVKVR
jgi:hypothetical protein